MHILYKVGGTIPVITGTFLLLKVHVKQKLQYSLSTMLLFSFNHNISATERKFKRCAVSTGTNSTRLMIAGMLLATLEF